VFLRAVLGFDSLKIPLWMVPLRKLDVGGEGGRSKTKNSKQAALIKNIIRELKMQTRGAAALAV